MLYLYLYICVSVNLVDIFLFCFSFRDCQDDKSAWTTFHLSEIIALDEQLDVSKVRVATAHAGPGRSLHLPAPHSSRLSHARALAVH